MACLAGLLRAKSRRIDCHLGENGRETDNGDCILTIGVSYRTVPTHKKTQIKQINSGTMKILDDGTDTEKTDFEGMTRLHLAIENSDIQLVSLLAQH